MTKLWRWLGWHPLLTHGVQYNERAIEVSKMTKSLTDISMIVYHADIGQAW